METFLWLAGGFCLFIALKFFYEKDDLEKSTKRKGGLKAKYPELIKYFSDAAASIEEKTNADLLIKISTANIQTQVNLTQGFDKLIVNLTMSFPDDEKITHTWQFKDGMSESLMKKTVHDYMTQAMDKFHTSRVKDIAEKNNIPEATDNFKELIMDFTDFVIHGESPLEEWLELENNNLTEIKLLNIVYGFLFILEEKPFEMDETKANAYIRYTGMQIGILSNHTVKFDHYMKLYFDRLKIMEEELKNTRLKQLEDDPYFQLQYYSKVLNHPLEIKSAEESEIFDCDWSRDQLADMFAHQINHLRKGFLEIVDNID